MVVIDRQRFAILGVPECVWAVGAIHGEVSRLHALHRLIAVRFRPGHRLVYLGNFLGHGPAIGRTMDELLTFRRVVLSTPGVFAADVVYLRGSQEEMWQKLFQIQFAPDPETVLDWMSDQGVAATLEAYGGSFAEARRAAAEGAVALTRWAAGTRDAMRRYPGHDILLTSLKRAALTGLVASGSHELRVPGLLFVSAGLDPDRGLASQGDGFWWGSGAFDRIEGSVYGFSRIIRGCDPKRQGVRATATTVTLDGGCGFGGSLICAGFNAAGEMVDLIET